MWMIRIGTILIALRVIPLAESCLLAAFQEGIDGSGLIFSGWMVG